MEPVLKSAFRRGDHAEVVRLLPLLTQHKIFHCFQSGTLDFFHLSSRNGWLDVMKDLITGVYGRPFDPQERNYYGKTCLHYAAEGNHVHVVRYLITECNCDPMATDTYGNTVLHIAAAHGSLGVIKYLINHHNCNPMASNDKGENTLHCAVEHIDIVKYLINEHYCDPMVVEKFGRTLLHMATYKCYSSTIEYLLLTGRCDPLVKDNTGRTSVQIAEGSVDILPIFKKFGQIKVCHPIDFYVNVFLLVILELVKVPFFT